MNLDITKIFGVPFTGLKVRKGMNKRQALQMIFGVLEESGLSSQVFGKSKPSLITMPESEVTKLITRIKTLVNS